MTVRNHIGSIHGEGCLGDVPMARVMGLPAPALTIFTRAAFCIGLTRQAITVGITWMHDMNLARKNSSLHNLRYTVCNAMQCNVIYVCMHACVGMPYKRRNTSSTSDIISYALAKTMVQQMYVRMYVCIVFKYLCMHYDRTHGSDVQSLGFMVRNV